MGNYAVIKYSQKQPIISELYYKLFELSGDLNSTCKVMEIPPFAFVQNIITLRELDGFFVMPPYNHSIIPHLDKLSDNALFYDYVDVVKNENGLLVGYCGVTDAFKLLADQIGLDFLEMSVLFYGYDDLVRVFTVYSATYFAQIGIVATETTINQAADILRFALKKYPGLKSNILLINEIKSYPSPRYTLLFSSINENEIYDYPIADEVISKADFF